MTRSCDGRRWTAGDTCCASPPGSIRFEHYAGFEAGFGGAIGFEVILRNRSPEGIRHRETKEADRKFTR